MNFQELIQERKNIYKIIRMSNGVNNSTSEFIEVIKNSNYPNTDKAAKAYQMDNIGSEYFDFIAFLKNRLIEIRAELA